MAILFLCLGILAGFLGGLTGIGGVLIPPVLIGLLHMDTHVTLGTAQASFIIPSILGAWMFFRKGYLDWTVALTLSAGGLLFTYVGAELKAHMSAGSLSLFLALFILASGVMLLRPIQGKSALLAQYVAWRTPALLALGSLIGLLSGITGVGTNALLVPIMLYAGINPLATLAACQFYAFFVACSGTVGNALNQAINLPAAFWLTVGQVLGMYAGVSLAQRIRVTLLKHAVAAVCLATGVLMLANVF